MLVTLKLMVREEVGEMVAEGELVAVGHSESESEGVTLGVGEDARVVPMGEVE